MSMNNDQPILLTKEEIRELICSGVEDALIRLGLDAENPLETQADLRYLRMWRLSVETAKTKGMMVAVGIIVSGIIGTILLGLKNLLN